MFLSQIIFACLILFSTVGAPAQGPVASGVLQGHLSIFSPATVQPDDATLPDVTAETYRNYPIVVLTQDGKKEIARVTADEHGNFRVVLPAGAYILDVYDRVRKHVRAKPQPFTVLSNETTRVDLQMDTGIR